MRLIQHLWRWLHAECPACDAGRLYLDREEYTHHRNVPFNVYRCDRCSKEWV